MKFPQASGCNIPMDMLELRHETISNQITWYTARSSNAREGENGEQHRRLRTGRHYDTSLVPLRDIAIILVNVAIFCSKIVAYLTGSSIFLLCRDIQSCYIECINQRGQVCAYQQRKAKGTRIETLETHARSTHQCAKAPEDNQGLSNVTTRQSRIYKADSSDVSTHSAEEQATQMADFGAEESAGSNSSRDIVNNTSVEASRWALEGVVRSAAEPPKYRGGVGCHKSVSVPHTDFEKV
ncbi:hypothetical protein WH47_01693 [Habropoda laboriosa]|uniref:Uncharacterized protein n=1 Tax=Habropoda laboriosa TaxID=597456 RepID=A0A0L7QZT6_9HYME|nr:hypothetical protein WH47_01693 [Habropoda laboriosa]